MILRMMLMMRFGWCSWPAVFFTRRYRTPLKTTKSKEFFENLIPNFVQKVTENVMTVV